MLTLKNIFKTFTVSTAGLVIFGILLLDQSSKIYIKTHYAISAYGNGPIVDWGFFKLLFVENKGMAMGANLTDFLPFIGEDAAKLILTLFRLIVIGFVGYWLWKQLKKSSHILLRWALCLIFAGALGNILDSVFYGALFTHSYGQVASFAMGEGYAPLFYGHVVDMLYFPLTSWVWPKWVPIVGGESYTFFQYVFNIADTAISTGVCMLIVFNKRIFKKG